MAIPVELQLQGSEPPPPMPISGMPESLARAEQPAPISIDTAPDSLAERGPQSSLPPGTLQIDRVLDYVTFVSRPMPLSRLLDEVPKRIAKIVGAPIASLYLLEGEGDALVLRGNVGFPMGARGTVRLSVGEGITGMAVERMRPVSVVHAPDHACYRSFPELPEERYPVFLAVPIIGPSGALGALAVQRAGGRIFQPRTICLVQALTTPIAAAIRHAEVLDDLREKHRRRAGGGTRKVTIPGIPVVPGRALGAIAALRRPATSSHPSRGDNDQQRLRGAFDVAQKALDALIKRAHKLGMGQESAFLLNYLLMVSDGRLRQRTVELLGGGHGVAQALGQVAREAVRAANGIVGDPFLQDRARDIEDLCDALLMLASPDARASLPSKAVLIGDQISVFDLLVSARAKPVGIALAERASSARTHVLLRLMNIPAIVDAAGVFRWASPRDVAVVDADHGFLVINPSRAEIASVRAARRKTTISGSHRAG